ncbi:hypothetical protein [Streptomyces sp. NPDC047525]|uniref:hypothetical protein n=1 Tax=Streptomyces sp. NPDC047525 TaxID=3155264 RepID=UPI003401837D
MTTDVTVRRLSVTARPGDGSPDAGRIDRLLRGVADHRLEQAVRAAGLPSGIWCLRRLDVPVRLDPARPDSALEAAWAAALVAALRRAMEEGSPDAVRYADERAAVLDLVCSTACGRTERGWAWRQVGLIHAAAPAPERAPGAAILAVLRRCAGQAPGIVTTAAGRVGLPALHRALGAVGWEDVAESVRRTLDAPALANFRTTSTTSVEAAVLADALLVGSRLAGHIGRSGLRPADSTLDAWALLVVAETDASALHRSTAKEILGAVARVLTGSRSPGPPGGAPAPDLPATADGKTDPAAAVRPSRGPEPQRAAGGFTAEDPPLLEPTSTASVTAAVVSGPESDSGPGQPNAWAGLSAGSAADTRSRAEPVSAMPVTAPVENGAEPDPEAGQSTVWAGLLFLLATAPAAGIPAAVLDDPLFAARPLPWVLQGIALSLLPTACTDPAVAAFAGADPEARAPWERGPVATPAERDRITELADGWAAVTTTALGGYDAPPREAVTSDDGPDRDPRDVVTAFARRNGHIHYAPGWTEAHLAADEVDVSVRRAGLDLDPGWVPWLGTVVRFVYV